MKHKHKTSSIVPKHNPLKQGVTNFLNKGLELKSYKVAGNNATVLLSLRYVQEDFECFSEWSKQEMKSFWDFNRSLHSYTWQNIMEQGGKSGLKVGFGYTKIPKKLYPGANFVSTLSPDLDFCELRLNSKARVHGFRDDAIFYICWLDRNHRICA